MGAWYANNLLEQPNAVNRTGGTDNRGQLGFTFENTEEIEIITVEKGFVGRKANTHFYDY